MNDVLDEIRKLHPKCSNEGGSPKCVWLNDYTIIPEYDDDGMMIGQDEVSFCTLNEYIIPSPKLHYCSYHELLDETALD